MTSALRTLGTGVAFLSRYASSFAFKPANREIAAMSTFLSFNERFFSSSFKPFSSLSSRVSILDQPYQLFQPSRFFSSSHVADATIVKSDIFSFPEKEAIISYLAKHPCTKDPYLSEKKIIEMVAKYVSNRELMELGIKNLVSLCFYHLRKDVDVRGAINKVKLLDDMQNNCVTALKDFASGKPI